MLVKVNSTFIDSSVHLCFDSRVHRSTEAISQHSHLSSVEVMQKKLFHETHREHINALMCTAVLSETTAQHSHQPPSSPRTSPLISRKALCSFTSESQRGQPEIMTKFGALNETPEHTSQTLILITTSAMGRQSVFLHLTSALTSISVSVCSYSSANSLRFQLTWLTLASSWEIIFSSRDQSLSNLIFKVVSIVMYGDYHTIFTDQVDMWSH